MGQAIGEVLPPRILGGLKAQMAAHNAAIMPVFLLVLGAKLTGDGIGGLSA
jgi:hypothetical protein